MKKILSIMLMIACILCVVSCGEENPPETSDGGALYNEVCTELKKSAVSYRECDEEEITQTEEFYTNPYYDYTDVIYSMFYAKMEDGKYVRCIATAYESDAKLFYDNYGNNYDYIVYKSNVVIFGTSPIIEEFKD